MLQITISKTIVFVLPNYTTKVLNFVLFWASHVIFCQSVQCPIPPALQEAWDMFPGGMGQCFRNVINTENTLRTSYIDINQI